MAAKKGKYVISPVAVVHLKLLTDFDFRWGDGSEIIIELMVSKKRNVSVLVSQIMMKE